MIKIDAFGKACPIPVMLVKKEIEKENYNNDTIEIDVDNYIAVKNITKLVNSLGANLNYTEIEGGYRINIDTSKCVEIGSVDDDFDFYINDDVSYLITNDKIGNGSSELGANLMQMFVYAMTQLEKIPKTIAFMNEGVKLCTLNDETIISLKELEEKGSRILVCGACLNYYNLADNLKVGEVSNAYEILDNIQKNRVINL